MINKTNAFKKLNYFIYVVKQKRSINHLDIIMFLQQLATLISAGITIIQSCEILEKSQNKIAMRLLIYTLKRELLSGKSLFYCIQSYSVYFDAMTSELIRIGEYTGKLDIMLNMIAIYHEKNLAFRNRIKRVLFYPSIIIVIAFIITFSMFLFVIPRFADLFHNAQIELPLMTQWIFLFSNILRENLIYLILIILCLGALCCSKRMLNAKKRLREIIFNLPFIKQLTYKIRLARFVRNLSITLSAGMPILEALKLATSASHHRHFLSMMTRLRQKISAGMTLHHAMENLAYFPALMIQMIKIGEESGKLEHMLTKLADFIEADIDQFMSHCHQLFEPLIMLMLGVLIGGLVIGMYLPIFKLGTIL